MRRIRFCVLLMCLCMLWLSACNDTVTTGQSAEPTPSASETETLSDAYRIKNGKLRLDLTGLGVDTTERALLGWTYEPIEFHLTEVQWKEKLMNLDFTAEELELITHRITSGGYAYVVDPRLITSFSLPNGCELEKVMVGLTKTPYGIAGMNAFEFQVSENADWGTDYYCTIKFAAGATGDGETGFYDDITTKFEEITDLTQSFSSYTEKNGRTYYISYKESTSTVFVRTFNSKHCYYYHVENPTEECIKNILDYDPFTYLQVEY